jgi:hypothetical protein
MPSYAQFDIWQNTAGLTYGNVLQIVQGTGQSSAVTVSGTTPTATGVTVTITPYYATSKILILGHIHVYKSGGVHFNDYVARNGGTNILGSHVGGSDNDGGTAHYDAPVMFLDSPTTTAATTYNWWVYSRDSTGVVNVNDGGGYRSNIMALEIASS